jgi:hypothetical protein
MVREPWERALERVADTWERVVLASRDRAVRRLSDRLDDDVAGSRAGGVPVRVAALLVLTAAGAGIGIAVASGRVTAPPSASVGTRSEVHPDPFAARLPAMVRVLASERDDALRRLRHSGNAAGQASAAETVASAYRASASKLAPAATSDGARAATLRSLRNAAVAYERLARAAKARDARTFSAARAGIERAERTVRRALRRVTTGRS